MQSALPAKLVKTGQSVSLALPLATVAAPDNPTPVTHLMVETGFDSQKMPVPWAGDYFAIAPHGMANTHLDALCHMFHKGKMYNGFNAEEVGAHGARRCAIDVTREGIVSRGVLLDIPRLRKKDWMEPGDRIFPEELDAAEKAHGVKVEEGDVLLIRTGRSAMRKAKGAWDPTRVGAPGLDAGCLEWLHDRKIAVLGSDSGRRMPGLWSLVHGDEPTTGSRGATGGAWTCESRIHPGALICSVPQPGIRGGREHSKLTGQGHFRLQRRSSQ